MKKLSLLVAALALAACNKGNNAPPQAQVHQASSAAPAGTLLINGAGSTFAAPLYDKWAYIYKQSHPNVAMNYQAIGSGAGIQQITKHTVDFGGTDAPMTEAQLAAAPGILHFPTALGAVPIAYNIPELTGKAPLRLTPETLAGIYLGKITKWNDRAIAKTNPGVKLPNRAIVVAHRADGSGTTAIFTDYLNKVSPEWKEKVGSSTSVKWPVGLGGKGNAGVSGIVKQNPGAIGYVELAYAMQNHLQTAVLENKAGKFIAPTVASTTASAAGVEMPADFRVSITDSANPEAYPITGFTWLLLFKNQTDAQKGPALVGFVHWGLHQGQQISPSLDYAPLPESVVSAEDAQLKTVTINGQPVSLPNG